MTKATIQACTDPLTQSHSLRQNTYNPWGTYYLCYKGVVSQLFCFKGKADYFGNLMTVWMTGNQ